MKRLLVFVFAVVLFFSCSKYPENNGITLKSKESRLKNDWILTEVNDEPISTSYTFSVLDPSNNVNIYVGHKSLSIKDDGKLHGTNFLVNSINSADTIQIGNSAGYWWFDNNKTVFVYEATLYSLFNNDTNWANFSEEHRCDILKLEKSELILLNDDSVKFTYIN